MERFLGWLLVLEGVLALALTREGAVFTTTVGVLAAGPLVNLAFGKRAPMSGISTVLSIFAFTLPWPIAERMTLIAAAPVLQYVQSESVRLVVAAASLMIVAGQAKLSAAYVVLSGLWVLSALIWLAYRQVQLRARRAAGRRWRVRDWAWTVAQLALSVAFAAGSANGLPAVERWFVEHAVNLDLERQSGFSTRTDLNGVESIRNSSKVALRIFEPGPYLMRGQGYGVYKMGVWTSARQGTFPQVPVAAGTPLRDPVRVQCSMDGNRIAFAPLEWGQLATPSPLFQDSCRVVVGRESTHEWSFASLKAVRRPEPLSDADRKMYLQVPPEVESALRPYVTALMRPGMNDRQKVQGLLFALDEQCEYTLEPGKPKGEEPIVRFLLKTKKGHCEYFASSLALLARIAGVPSRYMTGYAATERNKFGGYLMARDMDAHAWTEIYFPGEGWTTWDPTPAGWQAADEKDSKLGELWRELTDYLTERWETFYEWFSQKVLRPLGELAQQGLPLVIALAVLGALVWFAPKLRGPLARLWAWLMARFRRPPVEPEPTEEKAAAAALGLLEQLLEGLGLTRGQAVTPAELAARLEAQGHGPEVCAAARDLIDAFCRFRYGGAAWDGQRAQAALDRLRAHLTPPPPAR